MPEDGLGKADLRLVVPAMTVWSSSWLITGWRWGVWVVGLLTAAGLVLLIVSAVGRTRRRLPSLLIVLVTVLMGFSALATEARIRSLEDGPLSQAASQRMVVQAEVVVRASRESQAWGMAVVDAVCERGVFAGQAYRLSQPVVVLVPAQYAAQWLAFRPGSVIAVTVRGAPSEFADATAAVFTPLNQPRLIRPPPRWQAIIESMRTGLVQAVASNPPQQAGLVPGLVVGDTSAMSASMMADFRATGLTHLVAVSGANLAILLAFLSAIARRIGLRGYGLSVVSAGGIALFIALCHCDPSVLRAAAMAVVALASVGHGGGPSAGVRGLCLAVMGLCWIDPWMSRSVGFVLSVLACAGIIVWGRRWAGLLGRWLPGWMAEAMAIPLAAQIATQPVICWLSGAISVAGLAANAAAGPWVAPATVIGLIAALVSPLSPVVASWAGYVAGWCAQPILTISGWLAGLPGASHPWPATAWGLIVVTAGCLALAWVLPKLLGRAWAVLVATIVLVAAMGVAPYQPGWPGHDWRIVACDVGQGDALAIRVGQGQAIVIDVGPDDATVVRCLRQLGVREIPMMVLTHFHSDHAGAFEKVVAAFPVGSLLVPADDAAGAAILRLAEARAIPVSPARTGASAAIGDVSLTVVSAWRPVWRSESGEESAAENDASLIIRVDTPQMSLLDTGDAEVAGQQAAMRDPAALKADVLKVPHHGSARQDPSFLRATQARLALISVGEGNSYGHPAGRTVKELTSAGMEVVRTDQHGSIAISHDDDWVVTTQK